jgi:dTDP-4-amino-4,6-dideoxygalactose transaminase
VANADPAACLAACAEGVRAAIDRVLASGRFILGPEVEAFEREFAAWTGVGLGIAVANGTDALEIALRACGLRPGDGVVVPANTVSATAAAVTAAGGRLVPCDCDARTMCLSPARLAGLLAGPRGGGVRFVVPVHLYGHPCAMPEIEAVARRHGLTIVEDCAQAHGAAIAGRKAGAWGRAAAFSFYPTKNLAALGDGGAVLTGDPEVAERARALRQYGWRERYVSSGDGGRNSRLDEIQAAVLRVRLGRLEAENLRRRALAARYFAALAGEDVCLPPGDEGGAYPVYHQFVVRTAQRDGLRAWLAERGVIAQVLYPQPVHRQPAFAAWAPDGAELAECESACARVLSLPVHAALADADADRAAALVRAWLRAGRPAAPDTGGAPGPKA